MSYLDRIRAANNYDPGNFLPFVVTGVRVGCVKAAFAETLARWPEVFRVDARGVTLAAELDSSKVPVAERTRAVGEVLQVLREEQLIDGWRDEHYPVNRSWTEAPYLLIERAAVPWFGVRGYGVHMNGFVRDADGLKMWIARRSLTKPTGPGKLDQMVAGGQPAGIGLYDNMMKECEEEAGIPLDIAKHARPVGAISYVLETKAGLRPDLIFNFDLELPQSFSPVNTDGEVEAFYLWPIERVAETVRDSDDFKFNCALVIIDFLLRQGYIAADDPHYPDIVEGLMARPAPLSDW
jgi:8-oxo-dGTP pyrophosphatase MutT (NUDIX family)